MILEYRFQFLAVASALAMLTASSAAFAAKPIRLEQVFDPDMINVDVAYFERVTGPARNTLGEEAKLYNVDGCHVIANISGGTVRSLVVHVSPECTFDINKFLPSFSGKFPPVHTLTFGKFDSITGGDGRFYADCFGACGNNGGNEVKEHWGGSKFHDYLHVMLHVEIYRGSGKSAADKWEASMEKAEGFKWVYGAKFNCTDKYDAIAHQLFRDVTITAITIGRDVEPPYCRD